MTPYQLIQKSTVGLVCVRNGFLLPLVGQFDETLMYFCASGPINSPDGVQPHLHSNPPKTL